MFTQIISALSLVKQLIDGAFALQKLIAEQQREAWFKQSAKTFVLLAEAKTPEERKNAAKEIARLWANV